MKADYFLPSLGETVKIIKFWSEQQIPVLGVGKKHNEKHKLERDHIGRASDKNNIVMARSKSN